LDIANYNKLESIAFCCISTGVFNFPQDLAAEIAIETVDEYLKSTETTLKYVIFNVFTDKDYLIYKKLLFED
jgi:O-acetyl-ADP-ribose deacetylase (regulator of RNase III)